MSCGERTSTPTRIRWGIRVAVFGLALGSFWLRTHFVHERVIRDDAVRFMAADCWYHVRSVETLVRHFPHWNSFDPYAVYPGGQTTPVAPLQPYLLAAISLLLGGGSPTVRTIELVCAYAPPVLGALTVFPVYAIGRILLNRTTGLLAAGLIVLSPGQILTRTLLGYADHHALEIFLSTLFFAICALALRRSDGESGSLREAGATLSNRFARSLMFPILAGVCLGLYLLTWLGGSLLGAIFAGWCVIQWCSDYFRRESTAPILKLASPALIVALLLVVSWKTELFGRKLHVLVLAVSCASLAILAASEHVIRRTRWPRRGFPFLALALAAATLALCITVYPGIAKATWVQIARLLSARANYLIPETDPLLIVDGRFTLARAWTQFTGSFFLSLPGLALLAIRGWRERNRAALLVCVWSVVMLAATLFQNRFAYYYAINAALLSAYAVAQLLGALQSRWLTHPPQQPSPTRGLAWQVAAGVGLFLLLFYPNIGHAMQAMRNVLVPPDEWIHALRWIRENTPEPFGDPSAYYARYEPPARDSEFEYPDSAYGVLSSWSYGYWILRIGHRMPNANPGQHGATPAARFLLTDNDERARRILNRLGTRYVMIDSSMPYMETSRGGPMAGRVRSLAVCAGLPWEQFVEQWRTQTEDGGSRPLMVYYPDYYRSLLARLYIFRGKPVEPGEVFVLSYQDAEDEHGERYKLLKGAKRFTDYRTALEFLESLPPGTARLAGTDPVRELCADRKRNCRPSPCLPIADIQVRSPRGTCCECGDL